MINKVSEDIYNLFRSCIVKVASGDSIGSGFFVSPGKILTCAHVVQHEGDNQNILILWKDEEYKASIELCTDIDYPDLCLLKIENLNHPCVLLDEEISIGDKIYTFGYTSNHGDGDSSLLDYEGPSGTRKILLKFKNSQLVPGMSGSPILNQRTGKVCGLLKSSRDVFSDIGGRGISASTFFSQLDTIKYQNRVFHEGNDSWDKAITSYQSLTRLKRKVIIALNNIGFTTQDNIFINNREVDIYAEKTNQLYEQRFIVECYSKGKPLTEDSIKDNFLWVSRFSKTLNNQYTGLLVCDYDFDDKLLNIASECNAKVITLRDLQKMSFDPTDVIKKTIENYQLGNLSHVYIELSCETQEGKKSTVYKPVEKFFDTFFNTTDKGGIAVLGNFGTGKSSLCKHYAFLLATRWLENPDYSYLPILINLRDFKDFSEIENALFQYIKHENVESVTFEGLINWLKHGKTLLILDGFDEMASKMNRIEINKNIQFLSTFTKQYNAKIILTCRTHFFKTQIEEDNLKFLRLYILDWGNSELEAYVQKSNPTKFNESLEVIKQTYNLEELAKTPLFLNMISESIESIGGSINQAKLYQVYTDRWIQSQDYRSLLLPDQKQTFMEELALVMFNNDILTIKHSEFPNIITKLLPNSLVESLKDLDAEIRTCTFLVRNTEGDYYFVHKSFMEFFIGLRFSKDIKSNDFQRFSKKEISIEVAGFIKNYFDKEPNVIIRGLFKGSTPIERINYAKILSTYEYNDTILNALLMAIKTDESKPVKEAAVTAISSFEQDLVVNEIIALSQGEDDFSVFCLGRLEAFSTNGKVISFLRKILKNGDKEYNVDKSTVVIRIIAKKKIEGLLNDFKLFLVDANLRFLPTKTKYAILNAIDIFPDIDLAKIAIGFFEDAQENDFKSYSGAVIGRQKVKLREIINDDVKELKNRNNNYQDCLTILLEKYSFIYSHEEINNELKLIF